MKPGRASRTAELVAMGRAIAHGVTLPQRFSDPTALRLLSAETRARVAEARSDTQPAGLRARAMLVYLRKQASAMVARTVAIDDAIRERVNPQLVILGAGLDGRAFRMSELRESIVFEVDHPASQREKRERSAPLAPAAREVRFVAVDFQHDDLDAALVRAGHDPSRATTWVWEGVVMYLTRAEVDSTLGTIARRSATGSRVIVVYHRPAALLLVLGPMLRVIGEPLRSAFMPEAMRTLLAKHGWGVVRDLDLPAIGASLSPELAAATKLLSHMRIAIADRPA